MPGLSPTPAIAKRKRERLRKFPEPLAFSIEAASLIDNAELALILNDLLADLVLGQDLYLIFAGVK